MSLGLRIDRADPPQVQIERFLQQQIQTGTLKPGKRLPSNMELARKWRVSCTVVQKALANLTAAGLLVRAPRRGTHVRRSTAKAAIGLLFGPSLANETAHFYRAILKSLQVESKTRDRTCRVYDGLSEAQGVDQSQAAATMDHLRNDLSHYPFQGFILVAPERKWTEKLKPLVDLPVAVWNPSVTGGDVELDGYAFARESVAFLVGQGRRRLAYLRSQWHLSTRTEDLDGFLDAVREHRLPSPAIAQIDLTGQGERLEHDAFEAALRFVARWKSRATQRRVPDGLLVNDDIVMRAVAMALLKAGVEVPRELTVVCMTNQEVNFHYGMPVARHEFSTRELAAHLHEILGRRMRGGALPPLPVVVRGRLRE